jgi:hypothetical protein
MFFNFLEKNCFNVKFDLNFFYILSFYLFLLTDRG